MRKILYLLPVAAFFVSCVADSIQEELSTSQGQYGVCLFDASISEREGTRVVGEWGTDGILAEWESSDRIGVFAGDETQAAVFTVKELDGTNAGRSLLSRFLSLQRIVGTRGNVPLGEDEFPATL